MGVLHVPMNVCADVNMYVSMHRSMSVPLNGGDCVPIHPEDKPLAVGVTAATLRQHLPPSSLQQEHGPFYSLELSDRWGQSLATYFYDHFIVRFFPMEDERDPLPVFLESIHSCYEMGGWKSIPYDICSAMFCVLGFDQDPEVMDLHTWKLRTLVDSPNPPLPPQSPFQTQILLCFCWGEGRGGGPFFLTCCARSVIHVHVFACCPQRGNRCAS